MPPGLNAAYMSSNFEIVSPGQKSFLIVVLGVILGISDLVDREGSGVES